MAKLKNKNKVPKFNNKFGRSDSKGKEYPFFCFKHLTTNKKYNFFFFANEKDKKEAKSIIFDKLLELQTKNWQDLYVLSKKKGIETLNIEQLNFNPFNFITTKDMKVLVLRLNNNKNVNSQEWRLIGIKSDNYKGVLHVIGFDFNYNAYKH